MTNREWINSLPDDRLASMLIHTGEGVTEEYDWDENPIEGYPYCFWVTTDSEEFENYAEALEHQIQWLKDEKKD